MAEEGDGTPPTSLDIKLLVPRTSDGWVYVCDANNVTLSKFPIYRIIFFARGNAISSESACFAFTCAVFGQDKVRSRGGQCYFHDFRRNKLAIFLKNFCLDYFLSKSRNLLSHF
jgi:hypothetical protein